MPTLGRPTIYAGELADRICDAIATSDKGLSTLYLEDECFPAPSTIYRWLQQYPDFKDKYTRARADQAQLLADQIVSIADETQIGEITTDDAKGRKVERRDMLEHRRLRIESRKWVAAKLLPQKYGERQQLEHTGKDGGPVQFQVKSILEG